MSEQKVSFSVGQGGNAGQLATPAAVSTPETALQSNSAAVTTAAAPIEEGELTPALVRQIIAEVLGAEVPKVLEKSRRETQSQTAKMEARVQDRVNQQIALLKTAGITASADQTKAIETAIRAQEPESTAASPGTQAAQPGAEETPEVDRITANANALMDAWGVDIETTDPEAALIDRSSETAIMTSLAKAIQTKMLRTSTNPAARTPAGGGSPSRGATDHMNGAQTLEYGLNKALKR